VERAAELGQRFEHVVCTGVLHHLPDPDVGAVAVLINRNHTFTDLICPSTCGKRACWAALTARALLKRSAASGGEHRLARVFFEQL
jgi:2-polyprenyl-3-methyl-5-hydroxy-6-metoxy-1,4-benzoquinol methylase